MKNEELFRGGSVWRAIFSMAVPSIVITLVMILYNMADMYFIGRLGDTAQVAAVSIVSPVFSILAAIATMLGAGGCALIARCLGAGEYAQGRVYSSLCLWSGLLLGLTVGAALLAGAAPLLQGLGATPDILPYAETYLRVLALGSAFMILSNTLAMLVRAEGAVKEGLIGNVLGTVTNLVLDPVFILVLGWGVAGAAAASVLGNIVATGCYLRYILRHGAVLTADFRPALQKPSALFRIAATGLPNGVSSLLSGFASTFSNRLLSAYGTSAVAAMGAAGKTTMLISMILMALNMGCQPLLAYCCGAGDGPRMRELLRKLTVLNFAFGICSGTLCLLGRQTIIGMFLQDAAAAQMGQRMVVWLVLGSPFIGLTYLATNLLQATGRAAGATALSVTRQGLLLIPLLCLLDALLGVWGIAAAHLCADLASAALGAGILLVDYRRRLSQTGRMCYNDGTK